MAKKKAGAEVRGLDVLDKKLRELAAIAGSDATADALMEAGYIIERAAKENAPVDTGKLRASYFTKLVTKAAELVKVIVGTLTSYAAAQEFGTRYQSGKPHLRPAFDDNKQNVLKVIANILKEKIASIAR